MAKRRDIPLYWRRSETPVADGDSAEIMPSSRRDLARPDGLCYSRSRRNARPRARRFPLTEMRFALTLALALGALSCASTNIPNTDVHDTDENRKVISFCEEYRRAVEQKKVGFLLELADPAYYEDGG